MRIQPKSRIAGGRLQFATGGSVHEAAPEAILKPLSERRSQEKPKRESFPFLSLTLAIVLVSFAAWLFFRW